MIGLTCDPYLTLPYGEGVLPPSAEAYGGPDAHDLWPHLEVEKLPGEEGDFGAAQLMCFTGTLMLMDDYCYDLQAESPGWLFQVATCRGRGHILSAPLQAAKFVMIKTTLLHQGCNDVIVKSYDDVISKCLAFALPKNRAVLEWKSSCSRTEVKPYL